MKLASDCLKRCVPLDHLEQTLPHFDCRLGHYSSWEEARALLLWRTYDCSVNGVSDAVYQTHRAGKKIMGGATPAKLQWLAENGLLPLPAHQARGAYFVRVRRAIDGVNPKTGDS